MVSTLPQNALVTGCSGFIGMELVKVLAREGYEVTGLVRKEEKAQQFKKMGIDVIVADITKKDELWKAPIRAEAIFHLAASRSSERENVYQVNVEGTRNLVDRCLKENVKVFVYASSVAVYGDKRGRMVDEDSPINPDMDYSWSKVKAERILLNAYSEYGFPATILRLAWVYGHPLIEAVKKGAIRLIGRRDRWFGFVHIADAVRALKMAAEKTSHGEIFTVADDEPVTFKGFFYFLADTLLLPRPKHLSETAMRIVSSLPMSMRRIIMGDSFPSSDVMKILTYSTKFSNAKIKRKLGFEFTYPTYRQGILQFLREGWPK